MKAVIPCGGLGTRFLPITKSIPKELLPIVDVPVLSYIINESINSGVTEVLIVINPKKQIIKDYFSRDDELYEKLHKLGKADLIEQLNLFNNIDIRFIEQKSPLGLAHAVYLAKEFVGNEPFCLLLGDDLTISETPVTKQLIDAFYQTSSTIIGVQRCDNDDIVKYGVADVIDYNGKFSRIKGIIEKPPISKLPSRLACFGRYILKDIFRYIKNIGMANNGEYLLTDALGKQCLDSSVFAYEFEGSRYDMGDKLSSLKAAIELSLLRKDFGKELKKYIKELATRI